MIDLLTKVVIRTYKDLLGLDVLKTNKISNERVDLYFKNEVIKLDNTVGGKYRLYFDDYEGTIDKFRSKYDQIRKVNYIYCDTGYFIDLTESFIKEFAKYYNIN